MQFVSRDTRVGNRGGRPESVLLIDRDDQARELLQQWLEREGLSLEVTHNAVEGLDCALSGDHAIVILDIMLPGFNGFELLRRMRATSQIPVVITTARAEEVDRIVDSGSARHSDSHPARVSTPKSSCGARARQSEFDSRISSP